MFFVFNLICILLLFAWGIYQNANSVYFAYEYTPTTFKNAIDFSAYTVVLELAIAPMVYAFMLLVLLVGNGAMGLVARPARSPGQITMGILGLAIVLLFIISHGVLLAVGLEFEMVKNWSTSRLETLHTAYKAIVLSRLALCVVGLVLGVLAVKP